MKRIVCALATSAVAVTLMAGTAAAEGVDETWTPPTCVLDEEPALDSDGAKVIVDEYEDGDMKPITCDDDEGGAYPPAPIQVWLPNPVIDYGQGLMAKGKGLCPGIPAVFAVQSASDWTVRVFSPDQWVAEDGTSWYKFSPSELAGLYGPVTVYVKQGGKCEGSATTSATINKKAAPAPAPTPTPAPDNGTSKPDGSGGLIPAPAAPAPAAVVNGGVTAPAASPVAVSAAGATPTAAAAAPTQALPTTGSTTDGLLQIALVALATGLGMIYVTSARRRQNASASTR